MDLPALKQLMGAYLHQDYDLFGDTPMAAAEQFLSDEPHLARLLPAEIDRVLDLYDDEAGLAQLLHSLGCQIAPPDGSYRTWLTRLAAYART